MKRFRTISCLFVALLSAICAKRPPLPGPLPQRRRGRRIGLRAVPGVVALLPAVMSIAAPAQEIYLRADQVGYLPSDVKSAVAFSKTELPDSFVVVDDATQRGGIRQIGRAHV